MTIGVGAVVELLELELLGFPQSVIVVLPNVVKDSVTTVSYVVVDCGPYVKSGGAYPASRR